MKQMPGVCLGGCSRLELTRTLFWKARNRFSALPIEVKKFKLFAALSCLMHLIYLACVASAKGKGEGGGRLPLPLFSHPPPLPFPFPFVLATQAIFIRTSAQSFGIFLLFIRGGHLLEGWTLISFRHFQ